MSSQLFFSRRRQKLSAPGGKFYYRSNKDHLTDEQMQQINGSDTPVCPECDSKMSLRRSKYGLFYGCSTWPACPGTHGAHPDGTPLGVPATQAVKQLRIRAHELLDARFGRQGYFGFLVKTLGIEREHAHVALLTKSQLDLVITTLEGKWDLVR